MTVAHTPGPWHITDDGALPIKLIALDGRWKDRPGTNLGEIGGDVLHGTGDFAETLANARVCSAAPDLLAAAKAALSICGYGNRHNEAAIGKRLEDAIAKAEGRA